MVGFIFQGCSVVHGIIEKRFPDKTILQRLCYGAFYGSIILWPWFFVVGGVGVLDQFIHLKKRFLS